MKDLSGLVLFFDNTTKKAANTLSDRALRLIKYVLLGRLESMWGGGVSMITTVLELPLIVFLPLVILVHSMRTIVPVKRIGSVPGGLL